MAQVARQPIFSDAAGAGLCLHPPGCCPEGASCSTARAVQVPTTEPATTSVAHYDHLTERRPLTIVYGDRACTVDVTEAQAMEILSAARRGTGQTSFPSADRNSDGSMPVAAGTGVQGPAYPCGAVLGQSMKGSLRRFLEKRAARVSITPYSMAAKLHQ